MTHLWRFIVLLFALLVVQIVQIVHSQPVVTITAANIHTLESVQQIDFAAIQDNAGEINNGWFAVSPDAAHLAVVNREQQVVLLRDDSTVMARYTVTDAGGLPATMVDMAFDPTGTLLASVHLATGEYLVAVYHLLTAELTITRVDRPDFPLRIWFVDDAIWLEMEPTDYALTRYVTRLNSDEIIPSGPENDPNAYLRVGRVDAPYAITVTQSLQLQRWDLPTGTVTAEADIAALPGMGALSNDGRFFTWRDNESIGLYLLDVEQNSERRIAALGGSYLPFMALSPAADVVLGVNPGGEPLVTAWISATGQRIELGEYRLCMRPPDQVRLSADGTTLVIGCGEGLELWRSA